MITLRTIESLMSFLTVALAYVVSTTLAGYMQAWAAKKFGDPTAERSGFLTLNPLAHIDPVGAFCLFFLGIGWGKLVPINPAFVGNTFYLFILFLVPSITYVSTAFFSLLLLLWLFGLDVLNVAMAMVLSDYISLSTFTKIYPNASSLLLAIALILVMFIYIGVMFAVLTFILNTFRYALSTFLEHLAHKPENDFLLFLIPFITLVFFARPLKIGVVYGISYCAFYLAPLLGAT